MPFKTLTIKESAYKKLKGAKRPNESFSELIERTFKKRGIEELSGAWSDLSEGELEEIKDRIGRFRADADANAKKRMDDVLSRL